MIAPRLEIIILKESSDVSSERKKSSSNKVCDSGKLPKAAVNFSRVSKFLAFTD